MTDEWVRLDAPPPMPNEGEVVTILAHNYITGEEWECPARHNDGFFYVTEDDIESVCYAPVSKGGPVKAWKRIKGGAE